MADVLAKNWNANKLILTNLSICLVTLLIQGVQESPELLGDLLTWGREKSTNQLPMLRVLKELPNEAFSQRSVNREHYHRLQSVLLQQAPVLVDVVANFLNEGGSAELRIEALEVAKNWSANGLLPGVLVASKILQPVMNYIVPYQQRANQLKPEVVIPLVLEVVTTCLVIPDMKELPQCILAMFEWLGTRLSSWVVAMATGVPASITDEKDTHGSQAERKNAKLLKKLLGVFVDCIVEFIEEISQGFNVAGASDPQLQAAYVNVISTLASVLADSRLTISTKVVDSLLLLSNRISGIMSLRGDCWVWHVQDGKWYLGLLQNMFRSVLHNNTFRYQSNDLSFFYSDAPSSSSYREEISDYRIKEKTGELLSILHDLLVQADVSQKRPTLWTVSFICSDIQTVAQTLNGNASKGDRNRSMRRLEACVWAFSEIAADPLVRQKNTVQILATLRLLCQIPYNAVLTSTSAKFISRYKDVLDSGTLEDVRAVVSFILNQCIAGGENDHTVKNWDFRLVLTQTLRDVAQCKSAKVMEVLRSQAILPMARFADSRLKPPKMLLNDSKTDTDHYGVKLDTDQEVEHATLPLRLRGRLAQGFVQLAVQKQPPVAEGGVAGGLVQGGHNLVRWVVYPVLSQLDAWITVGNRAFLNGIAGELYILHMAMLPLQMTCSLTSMPGECQGPAITMATFPGVPASDKPLIPELCFAIMSMTRSINSKHMTSPNIVRHVLRLFERVTIICLRDIAQIPPVGKKLLADVVELTSILYANTPAGQESGYLLLKRITAALLGLHMKDLKKGVAAPAARYNLQDMPERLNFVYQIASGMCMIGELCAQALPRVKPDMKVVPMGSVAVARLRFYFEYLGTVIALAPQLFYRGIDNGGKTGPLLDRCLIVLSIVLLSADKRLLVKAALQLLTRLACEARPDFAPVVHAMFQDKLVHLMPPMFYIIYKIMTGDIDDDAESKSTILKQTAMILNELNRNFRVLFVPALNQVVTQMLEGSNSGPEACQQWTHRFAQCSDAFGFQGAISEFISSVLR